MFVRDIPASVCDDQQILIHRDPETSRWCGSQLVPLFTRAVSTVVHLGPSPPAPAVPPEAVLVMMDPRQDGEVEDEDVEPPGWIQVRVDGSFHEEDCYVAAGVLVDKVAVCSEETQSTGILRQGYEGRHLNGDSDLAEAMPYC